MILFNKVSNYHVKCSLEFFWSYDNNNDNNNLVSWHYHCVAPYKILYKQSASYISLKNYLHIFSRKELSTWHSLIHMLKNADMVTV